MAGMGFYARGLAHSINPFLLFPREGIARALALLMGVMLSSVEA